MIAILSFKKKKPKARIMDMTFEDRRIVTGRNSTVHKSCPGPRVVKYILEFV
jgi:hypothetical protein